MHTVTTLHTSFLLGARQTYFITNPIFIHFPMCLDVADTFFKHSHKKIFRDVWSAEQTDQETNQAPTIDPMIRKEAINSLAEMVYISAASKRFVRIFFSPIVDQPFGQSVETFLIRDHRTHRLSY